MIHCAASVYVQYMVSDMQKASIRLSCSSSSEPLGPQSQTWVRSLLQSEYLGMRAIGLVFMWEHRPASVNTSPAVTDVPVSRTLKSEMSHFKTALSTTLNVRHQCHRGLSLNTYHRNIAHIVTTAFTNLCSCHGTSAFNGSSCILHCSLFSLWALTVAPQGHAVH